MRSERQVRRTRPKVIASCWAREWEHRRVLNVIEVLQSWKCSCDPYAMVHRSILQWTKGERVPLSLYFISILWRLVMTAFQRRPKSRRFIPFPNNHRRPSKVLFRPKRRRFFPFPNNHRRPSKILFFLLLQRISSLFFLLLLYGLAFRHFFNVQQVTKPAVFNVRVG